MKKINFIALALLFVGTIIFNSCGDTAEGEVSDDAENLLASVDSRFFSEDGNFKVQFSGYPEISKENIDTDQGIVEMHMFLYEKSITEAEMIAYSDYPSSMLEEKSVDQMLEDAKGGSLESLEANVTEEKKFSFKGNKAIQYKADNAQFYVDYLIFMVNNRLYQVALMRDGSYASKENVDKLFNSFDLVEKK